jgi:hypothetical protein
MISETHATQNAARRISFGLLAVWLAGCAASHSSSKPGEVASRTVASDSTRAAVVMALDFRRTAELTGGRDRYRIQSADLSLEFRSKSNAFLDAGTVTIDDHPLERIESGTDKRNTIRYRARREALVGIAAPGTDGWAELVATGSSSFPPVHVRVQLAPLPEVISPASHEAHYRSQGLGATIEALPADVHVGVRFVGENDGFAGFETGGGRYEFPPDRVAQLAAGPARIVIDTGTSCSNCSGGTGLVLHWTCQNEVEIPITIFEP